MVNVRYQADADLNQAIVTGVLRREPNIDFQTAFAAELEGVKDPEVLAIAGQQGRILVSHDRRTMPSEFAEFIINHKSAGVIVVSRKIPIEVVIEELLMIWAVSGAEEWVDRIAKIPL
jgi:predicted nuclease of predicted toxin-antitoxin system